MFKSFYQWNYGFKDLGLLLLVLEICIRKQYFIRRIKAFTARKCTATSQTVLLTDMIAQLTRYTIICQKNLVSLDLAKCKHLICFKHLMFSFVYVDSMVIMEAMYTIDFGNNCDFKDEIAGSQFTLNTKFNFVQVLKATS